MFNVLSIGRIDQHWQYLDVGFSRILLKRAGSMPSLWNFASVYFVMIMSLKMNTTFFFHVTCIMTCHLYCLITSDRMFPILTHWTLMIKWYIWCHAMRLKKLLNLYSVPWKWDVVFCIKRIERCAVVICPYSLTHWGRVMHLCVSKQTIIGSDNGLSPGRRQAIIWTKAGILLIGPLGTKFNGILIQIHTFSFKKNAFENVVRKIAAILSWPQCVYVAPFLMYIHGYRFMQINSLNRVYVFIKCLSFSRYQYLASWGISNW